MKDITDGYYWVKRKLLYDGETALVWHIFLKSGDTFFQFLSEQPVHPSNIVEIGAKIERPN
jgi:hypothetical protein